VIQEDLDYPPDGSVNGTIFTQSLRQHTLAGYLITSQGQIMTEITQNINFTNFQYFLENNLTYTQNIIQRTRIISQIQTTYENASIRDQLITEEWPLHLNISIETNEDNTFSQVTNVSQVYNVSEVISRDNKTESVKEVLDQVIPKSTLLFMSNGSIIGPGEESSFQRYFSADSEGDCYSRELRVVNDTLTGILDGDGCSSFMSTWRTRNFGRSNLEASRPKGELYHKNRAVPIGTRNRREGWYARQQSPDRTG